MRLIPVLALTVTVVTVLAACAGGNSNGDSSLPPIPAPPDVAAAPADAQRTSDNLASKVLKPGTGTRHPRGNSEVTVHYTGWTTDGKMFDSSVARGEPATFRLDQVIPGWTEGVQMMVEGEKRRFWIPAKLAYEGMSGPQGTLVFDIELIRIVS
jgi:FKBP-type peptidyl-prolyl cis-trans isomerase